MKQTRPQIVGEIENVGTYRKFNGSHLGG